MKKTSKHDVRIKAGPDSDGETLKKKEDRSSSGDGLRKRAEKTARGKAAPSPESLLSLSPEEIRRTLHELQVHQIELEMQNEELRRSQDELSDSKNRYFDLYDRAPMAYFTVNEKGLICEVNLAAAFLLGLDRASLVKQSFSGFIFSDDRDIYYLCRKKLLETGSPQMCEIRMMKKDGALLWVQLNGSATADSDDLSVRVVVSDLTERKLAEELLRQSEEKYRSLVDNVELGVSLISPELKIITLNRKMREWFPDIDVEARPVCYRAFNSPPRGSICSYCPTHKTLRDGQVHEAVTETPVGGAIRNYRVVSSPLCNAAGAVVAAIETVEDITVRRAVEKKAQASLRFLEIVQKHNEMAPLLREFTTAIKDYTGCDSVGIRILDEEGMIPYSAHEGFSTHFYTMESPLSIRSDQCMCINVIKGTTDPQLPFFTAGGSFYSNGTTRLLATVTDEAKGSTRNMCNKEGYESVALIPFRRGDRILGLIHVADRRENMVLPEMVRALEETAMLLGTALNRLWAEETLRKSEKKYRDLVELTHDLVWSVDAEGSITYMSPASLRIYGRAPEEMVGRLFTDFVPPDQIQRDMADLERMKGTGEPVINHETRVYHRDGHEVILLTNAVVLRDGEGNIVGTAGTSKDITAQKQAEAALRLSEERLSLAVIGSGQGLWDWYLVRDKAYLSPRYLELAGYHEGEILPDFVFFKSTVHPDDFPTVDRTMKEHLQGRSEYSVVEYRMRKKTGDYLWVQGVGKVVERDAKGSPVRMAGTISDITERRRAADALRESEERFRHYFELGLVGMAITSPDKGCIEVNDEICRILGYDRNELLGMNWAEFTHPDDLAADVEQFNRIMAGEIDDYSMNKRYIRKDGSVIHATISVKCSRRPDGSVDYLIGLLQDITARKEAEDQIRHSLAEKEALLKEVHHRVKNNLQIIYSLLRLQSRQTDNETVRAVFAETQNRVRSIASVHELLYQSKDLSRIDFSDYVKNFVSHLFSSYGAEQGRIRFLLDAPRVPVSINNAIPLGLIINELVSNSLKYAFPERRSGEIAIAIVPGEEGSLLLTVADNGIGSPEGLDLRNTESLGMQLVMTLVTQLHATIDFENHAGLKTIITIPAPEALRQ